MPQRSIGRFSLAIVATRAKAYLAAMANWLSRLKQRVTDPPPVVAVLRLQGVISSGGGIGRAGLNLADHAAAIEAAFALKRLKAVALAINSPGGSPVQSALLAGRIRSLAAEKKVPVFAFAEDVAASGGYWLALAADEIHADPSSIIGSIGVISAGFGFTGLMQRIGVERRMHTAGQNKAFLDPFSPEREEDVARLKALQRELHANFRAEVEQRRAGRLKGGEELFTGEFWSGRRALELGLIDGLGDLRTVMRARFGDRVRLRRVGQRQSWLRRRLGLQGPVGHGLGSGLADGLVGAAEDRAHWARFGL
jgi:signal peptide peptidase SppA